MDSMLVRADLRLATEADLSGWPWAVPHIEGFERWDIDAPVLVHGAGPSSHATLGGAYSIAVNPRSDGPEADAAFALDHQYWKLDWWRDWSKANEGATAFYATPSRFHEGPEYPFACRVIQPAPRFKGYGVHSWACIGADGIMRKCMYSAIAAVLVAQYVSRGPTIITGCDLDGVCYRDRKEGKRAFSYREEQLPEWIAASHNLENVYCHPEMGGPLRDIFPAWKGAA